MLTGPLLPAGEESLASKSHALTGNRQPPASALRLLPPCRAIGNQTPAGGRGARVNREALATLADRLAILRVARAAALEGAAVDRGGRSMMCASKDTGPEKGGRISVM
jgi:hypothetical protein